MPKATPTNTTTAPPLVSGKAALAMLQINEQLAKLGELPALSLPAAALACAQPDASTSELIDRFTHLEHYRRSLYDPSPNAIENDDVRGELDEKINEAQEALIDRLEDRPIGGLKEVAALIGAALLWYPPLLAEDQGGLDGRILRIVFTALAPEAVAEADWRAEHVNELSAGDLAWLRLKGGAA